MCKGKQIADAEINPRTIEDVKKALRYEVERTARTHWGLKPDLEHGEESADEEVEIDEVHRLEGREEGLQWAFELILRLHR